MFYWLAAEIHDIFWRPSLVCRMMNAFMWASACHVIPENRLVDSTVSCRLLLSVPLQVWVIENSMEVVARQLLLLYLALMPQESMGLHGGWYFVELLILKARCVLNPVGCLVLGFYSQRRQRFTWRCLGMVRSAVKQRKYWNMQHHSSHCVLLKQWRQLHTPVWTQLFSRYNNLLNKPVLLCFCKTFSESDFKACSFKHVKLDFDRVLLWCTNLAKSLLISSSHFYSSRSETSWPEYWNCGSSLSLPYLHLRVLLPSSCPKPGIIGSGSTWELATTPREAASTGTLQWNCTRKGYLNICPQ